MAWMADEAPERKKKCEYWDQGSVGLRYVGKYMGVDTKWEDHINLHWRASIMEETLKTSRYSDLPTWCQPVYDTVTLVLIQ